MDESDRISDELYEMIMNQKEGCTCGICCTLFMFDFQDLLWDIMDDMKCSQNTSKKSEVPK